LEQELESQARLGGVKVGLAGRHELYVASLRALLEGLGASVRKFDLPGALRADRSLDVLVLEDPLGTDLEAVAPSGPPVLLLSDGPLTAGVPADRPPTVVRTLPKNVTVGTLTQAIREAIAWGVQRPASLTTRQLEVLSLIAEGLDNDEIALRLGISPRTARAHTSAILERLGVANRTQAAVAAVRLGFAGSAAHRAPATSLG
jgi:DNA-binding CsgD family transcriptional regulator